MTTRRSPTWMQNVDQPHDWALEHRWLLEAVFSLFEMFDQFIARAHRLSSRKPVTVYVMLTKGSLDEKKWTLLSAKAAAADLALDGQLMDEREEPISLEQVLKELQAKGVPLTGEEIARPSCAQRGRARRTSPPSHRALDSWSLSSPSAKASSSSCSRPSRIPVQLRPEPASTPGRKERPTRLRPRLSQLAITAVRGPNCRGARFRTKPTSIRGGVQIRATLAEPAHRHQDAS